MKKRDRVHQAHKNNAGQCAVCHRLMRWWNEQPKSSMPIRRGPGLCTACRYESDPDRVSRMSVATGRLEELKAEVGWFDRYVLERRSRNIAPEGIDIVDGEKLDVDGAWDLGHSSVSPVLL